MAARGKLEPHDVRFFATPAELRDWFDANHATAPELWLGYYKKASGRPSVDWSQAVDEALCVGWIDGILKRIDAESHVQRFTPRRKGSNWSAINVAKVARLTAEGRMRPAGLAAFEARTDANTAIYSYETAETVLTDDETARFRADAAAWADWEARPPSYRRTVDALGHERQAGRHARAAARRAHRGFPGGHGSRADARGARRIVITDPAVATHEALADAIERLAALDLGDAFEPRAAEAIVASRASSTGRARRGGRARGPDGGGGRGARWRSAPSMARRRSGSRCRSTSSGRWSTRPASPDRLRDRVYRGDRRPTGRCVNNAATEEGGGSPARGAIPGTIAVAEADGTWRLTGEKTWTTWLPNLTHAFVTARLEGTDPLEVGSWLVDLSVAGGARACRASRRWACADRRPAGSCSMASGPGRVRSWSAGRSPRPDPRGPAPGAWFGMAIAATYLGVGEGARDAVARWALDRRPGDGWTAVADIPSVQLRLGRLDAELRAARIVVLDVARRWDAAVAGPGGSDGPDRRGRGRAARQARRHATRR